MSEYETDKTSLFAEHTSPEGVDAVGGGPSKQAPRIPTLSVVLNVNASGDPLAAPSVYAQKGLSLAFPMLKLTSSNGLVEIKYLNKWTKPGGTGNRSMTTVRGYKGFAGKQLTFTAVFDDALPREHEDDVGPYYYTYETIELLRLWAVTEVTQKLSPIAYTVGILNIKKYVSPVEQAKIVQAYRDSLKPAGDTSDQWSQGEKFKAAHGAYTENYKLATVFENSPAAIAPAPPAPLRFQFGNIVLPRCVVTKADVTVTRYDGQRATAAEITIVLQEITAHTLWSTETPNREKLVRLIVNGQLTDVAPPP
jgi:hypothetical protein